MDKTIYEVRVGGETIKRTRSEKVAIHDAKAEGEGAAVVMCVESGEYRSTTQVWPTPGETWSNF